MMLPLLLRRVGVQPADDMSQPGRLRLLVALWQARNATIKHKHAIHNALERQADGGCDSLVSGVWCQNFYRSRCTCMAQFPLS
jgi:hypothetical protein